MFKHWEYTEVADYLVYQKFVTHKVPIVTTTDLLPNTAVYVTSSEGGKRLEGTFDPTIKAIRPLSNRTAPNRDLRLYLDALSNENITVIAVDGLMGTGKTSTCVEDLVNRYLNHSDAGKPVEDSCKILISKPHVNAGGQGEQYGFLPGSINEKLEPTLNNFIQYFDRFHLSGFKGLREAGLVEVLPLGFIRGLDAKNMIIIVDECQNTAELVSVVSRKASNSRVILLGDTSPYQIDVGSNSTSKNGLTHIMELLSGAPYFQYIEMKSLEHVVRSEEVKDIIRRLFKKYGQNITEWI